MLMIFARHAIRNGRESNSRSDIGSGKRVGKPMGMACGTVTTAVTRANQGMPFLDIRI